MVQMEPVDEDWVHDPACTNHFCFDNNNMDLYIDGSLTLILLS